MRALSKAISLAAIVAILFALSTGLTSLAQVSPAEITNSRLRQAEQTYFEQLIELNRTISQIKFPFPFVLSRYAGLDPKQQIGADQRGLEFITFENRTVLKISGNYNAAFSAQMLTANQRADRVLSDVVVPILKELPKYFSAQSDFDGFGFEISYHVRTNTRSYSYEGAQILTVVLDKADAFRYARSDRPSEQQDILDTSRVYVDGKRFGLMLGEREPVPVDEDEREPRRNHKPASTERSSAAAASPEVPTTGHPPEIAPEPPAPSLPAPRAPQPAFAPAPGALIGVPASPPAATSPAASAQAGAMSTATQAEADALQTKLQAQLDALEQQGRAHDGFVDYAPPSFAIFRKQIYLQLTLRNPSVFDKNATSIYKRAAQSFDLFLAPRLKALLARTPADPAIAGLDVTVLSEFAANASSSSEAIEYACPIAQLRQFADADITSQDLINQSVVLVNGVRIALNLQQAE
jgi:hypothetical protein